MRTLLEALDLQVYLGIKWLGFEPGVNSIVSSTTEESGWRLPAEQSARFDARLNNPAQ